MGAEAPIRDPKAAGQKGPTPDVPIGPLDWLDDGERPARGPGGGSVRHRPAVGRFFRPACADPPARSRIASTAACRTADLTGLLRRPDSPSSSRGWSGSMLGVLCSTSPAGRTRHEGDPPHMGEEPADAGHGPDRTAGPHSVSVGGSATRKFLHQRCCSRN